MTTREGLMGRGWHPASILGIAVHRHLSCVQMVHEMMPLVNSDKDYENASGVLVVMIATIAASATTWPWSMISAVVAMIALAVIVQVNMVRPRLRRRRLRRPAEMWFIITKKTQHDCDFAIQDDQEHLVKTIVVQQDREVVIDFKYTPRLDLLSLLKKLQRLRCNVVIPNTGIYHAGEQALSLFDMPLPIPREIHTALRNHRQSGHAVDLLAIGHSPAVLAPRRLLRVAKLTDAAAEAMFCRVRWFDSRYARGAAERNRKSGT
jgi:hypothetical protein